MLKGIHNAIDKLFDYKYTFTTQSEFHVKNWNIEIVHSLDLNDKKDINCPICYENIDIKNLIKTNCNHYYCIPCLNKIIENLNIYRKPCCALCRICIKNIDIYDNAIMDKIII